MQPSPEASADMSALATVTGRDGKQYPAAIGSCSALDGLAILARYRRHLQQDEAILAAVVRALERRHLADAERFRELVAEIMREEATVAAFVSILTKRGCRIER